MYVGISSAITHTYIRGGSRNSGRGGLSFSMLIDTGRVADMTRSKVNVWKAILVNKNKSLCRRIYSSFATFHFIRHTSSSVCNALADGSCWLKLNRGADQFRRQNLDNCFLFLALLWFLLLSNAILSIVQLWISLCTRSLNVANSWSKLNTHAHIYIYIYGTVSTKMALRL